jgi:membrane-associated phospholipid phosphatase
MEAYWMASLLFTPFRPFARELSILLNDPYVAFAASLALVLIVSYRYKEGARLPFLVLALSLGLVLGAGFKLFLQEPRPCIDIPGKIPCPLDFSLPSLHALMASTIAIVAVGNRSFPIYLMFALFVAFSRIYLGVHTIPQVAAGLALAFFACVLCEIIWRRTGWEIPQGVHIVHDARRLQA